MLKYLIYMEQKAEVYVKRKYHQTEKLEVKKSGHIIKLMITDQRYCTGFDPSLSED